MPSTMECDMLLDARCFNPFLQWTRNPRRTSQSFKYTLIWFSTFSAKGVGLFVDREIIHHMCLSLGEVHSPSTPCLSYFAPCKIMNVTQTDTSEYSKEEGTLQYFILTRSLGQCFCFFKCQCFSLDFHIRNAFHLGCDVNSKVFVNECTMQTCLYNREICSGRVLRESTTFVTSLWSREHEQLYVFK